jgi:hypothetical protein
MGDLLPTVGWLLEYHCPLKQIADWKNREAVARQLDGLSFYPIANELDRVFGDVIVTGGMTSEEEPDLPRGFVVSRIYEKFGGLDYVSNLCSGCSANAHHKSDTSPIAGCIGTLRPIDSPLLEDILKKTNLLQSFQENFLKTDSIAWGMWITSPLTTDQASILLKVFETVIERGTKYEYHERGYRHFIDGLKRFLKFGIPLHVELSPPGHVGALGGVMIFSHCPRCKAKSLPNQTGTITCDVCGNEYERQYEDFRDLPDSEYDIVHSFELPDILGEEEYIKFSRAYLLSKGHAETDIEKSITHWRENYHKRQAK